MARSRELQFHWRLLHGGETAGMTRTGGSAARASGLPDVERQVEFCRRAEEAGITGLLTDVGAAKPDPIVLATALGLATEKIEFIIAYRSNFCSPTLFVQQLNTLSNLIDGRFSLNIVAGHSPLEQRYYGDFLPHDERYSRTDEFLAIAHELWRNGGGVDFAGKYFRVENATLNTTFRSPRRRFPEIFIGGGSPAARELAVRQGTCWMRIADTPRRVAESAGPVLAAGKEVGLRLSIIARPTRDEALAAARTLVAGLDPALHEDDREKAFMRQSDSVSIKATYDLAETEWLTPTLWTGAVRTHGAPTICLVGTPQECAEAFIDYKLAGVTHFIVSGWPKLDEMIYFGEAVLPLVRAREKEIEDGQGALSKTA